MLINFEDCQLTEHFKLSEFCHHGNKTLEMYIDERFLDFVHCLEEFRVWYKRPINISSGFRPVKYNKSVGGSSNSSHLVSLAVDFNYPSEYMEMTSTRKKQFLENVRLKWARLCVKYGYSAQTNYYDNRFHLGFSLSGKYSFLDYRKENNG